MNASSKEATALDGAELTAKSLNYTASRKLFCLKTGEEIPNGTYQRRGHVITCCGGNCIQPEVADEGCPDANCNCAEGWKIDDAPEPPHGEESAHKINNEDRDYQFPFANSDLYDSDDESNNGSASGDSEEGDDQAAVEENARFDADAEEAYFGTGESGNDAAPSLKIGGVNISSKAACGGTCADKHCPAAQHYTRALMEWLDTLVSSSKDETSGTSESPENGAAEMRRTYENDIREAYNAMQRKLTDDDDGMLVDSGSNIHFLTLEDARKYFMSRRSTQLRVLGINGVRERCKAEGEIEMLVRDHLGKQLHLSLGTGYTSGKIPKSLLSASRLMASGAILHFEKGASYMELPRFKSRIDLVEKNGLFYIPTDKVAEMEVLDVDMENVDAVAGEASSAYSAASTESWSAQTPHRQKRCEKNKNWRKNT